MKSNPCHFIKKFFTFLKKKRMIRTIFLFKNVICREPGEWEYHMKEAKVVGIFGWEQTDLCIYLASILENMKNHVLVIDNSMEQKMDCCIPKPKTKLNIVTYKNVDYQRRIAVKEWPTEAYDFIIADLGKEPLEEELTRCEELILVTGCEYHYIQKYRAFMLQAQLPMVVIIRNYHKEMMLEKQIIKQLEEENCFMMEHYFLPFDSWDESKRITMQYEGYQDCSYLSKEFEKLLFHLVCMLGKQGYRAALTGMNRAKRGECY